MFSFIVRRLMKYRSFQKVINFINRDFMLEGISYSQNLEDLIFGLLSEKKKGIYVDVGAHHPTRFSNTFQLYLNGWSGINIDPLPECKELFDKYRPKDKNLNVGISNKVGEIEYYSFVEPAYNTINSDRANYLIENNISSLKERIPIKIITLKKVFDRYLKNKQIDLMTIDVETMEMDVLTSNDWSCYKPNFIIIESIVSCDEDIRKVYDDPVIEYLYQKGYIVVAKVRNAVFLKRAELNEIQ